MFMRMNKSKGWVWTLIVVAIVVVIAAVLWIVGVFSSSYYAVYLNTGDLYFGSLSPVSSTLTNVWYIQKDAQNQSLALADFSKVVWGSSGNLELNQDNVVWMTQLASDSKIIPVLKGESAMTQQAGDQQIPAPTTPTQPSASTTEGQ